jgi:hypothetical protein
MDVAGSHRAWFFKPPRSAHFAHFHLQIGCSNIVVPAESGLVAGEAGLVAAKQKKPA